MGFRYGILLALLGVSMMGACSTNSGSGPQTTIQNPLYRQWSAYGPGTTVTFDNTSGGQGALPQVIGFQLLSLSGDKMVLEKTANPPTPGGTSVGLKTPSPTEMIPSMINIQVMLDNPIGPWDTITEGSQSAQFQGRTDMLRSLQWVKSQGDETTTTTWWRSDDVPGGIVKVTLSTTRAGQEIDSLQYVLKDIVDPADPSASDLATLLQDLAAQHQPITVTDENCTGLNAFCANVNNCASVTVFEQLNTGSSFEYGSVNPTSCTINSQSTCDFIQSKTACNTGTGHYDVFTANSSGDYTVEQNYFEIQVVEWAFCENSVCVYTSVWQMAAHKGDGENKIITTVDLVSAGYDGGGCTTPEGGGGNVNIGCN